MLHTNTWHVVYLRLPRVVFIVGTDEWQLPKSRESYWGTPPVVKGSTGTIITKPTLIQQVNMTSLTLCIYYFVKFCNKETEAHRLRHLALTSLNHSVDRYQFIIVSNLRTNFERLSATVVVKPRQLIQCLSAFLGFLSTTSTSKTAPFISTSRNKTTAFAMVLHVNRRSANPENSRSAARGTGCFDGWRHHARGLLIPDLAVVVWSSLCPPSPVICDSVALKCEGFVQAPTRLVCSCFSLLCHFCKSYCNL